MYSTDYQEKAARTLIDGPDFELSDTEFMLVWKALGLAGEAGEVADTIKKGILHQHGLDVAKVEKELGDVLWYVAAISTLLGLDLNSIMRKNIDKLLERYPNGYNSNDSKKRVDVS